MLTQDTWEPAHRGSGGEYPEHTLAGYAAMLAAGATDIEVSVVMTADGVLVAHHDATLDRMTNATGPVSSWSYAQLRERVRVQAQDFLGAGWGDQPLPTLREVMDLLYGKCRIWLEAKVNPAVPVMRDWMLKHYPGCQRSVLWKAHYNQGGLANRHAEGWYVWAYVDAGTTDEQLDGIDHAVDMWGVPTAMSDARIAEIIARGKPVTMWEIHRFVDLARCDDVDGEGLVIQGRMSSRWHYLYGNLPDLATDHFDRRVSYPGTLGIAGYSPPNALRYDEDGGAYLDNVANRAVVLGPDRLPQVARTAGRLITRFRSETRRNVEELKRIAEVQDLERELQGLRRELRSTRDDVQGSITGRPAAHAAPVRGSWVPRADDEPPPLDPEAT
jgi:glycerophosphoryl diester phosphodiesterase